MNRLSHHVPHSNLERSFCGTIAILITVALSWSFVQSTMTLPMYYGISLQADARMASAINIADPTNA